MVKKVLIVGGGIAGLSAAWACAQRGMAVELFEQGALPNPRSSSFDEHRVIRHAYGRMAGYTRLMPEAYRIWERLWAATGRSHYEPCGTVVFLRQDDDWYDVVARSLDELSIDHHEVALDEVSARFPMIREDGLIRVVETGGAGILFPIPILTDLVVLLGGLGIGLHSHCRVDEVDPVKGTVRIGSTIHEGDVVVVAGGAWADRLVPDLRPAVLPSRQAVLYLAPPPALAEAWNKAPVMIDAAAGGGLYALPPRCGTRLKIGDHSFSRRGNPDDDRFATDLDLERLWGPARTALRDFESYTLLERKACFYTVHDREEFQVRPMGPSGWVISACSGHGFKLGPLMGELTARAITGEMDPETLPPIAAGRAIDMAWNIEAP
ncbi:FAD-dependent oxidoreductase [Gluconacetobacter azotocaptans]|uniref:FAD-dependent oxidoreductase n=1 Tax=Gluconacetobacter azotocaptans TaxID=142834 RepID=UPI00195BC04C|nr:FAD-dependent oxidoreductase [Gluconacetobacter azotocaptans]